MNLKNECENSTKSLVCVEKIIDKIENSLEKLKKMEEYIVDRIEEEFAVCENRKTGKMENIKLIELPKEVKEGSYIILKDNKYYICENEEKDIKKRIEDKMNNLWK